MPLTIISTVPVSYTHLKIGVMFSSSMIIYVVLTLFLNGAKMCVSTANTSFMADIVDYELDRTGKYVCLLYTSRCV